VPQPCRGATEAGAAAGAEAVMRRHRGGGRCRSRAVAEAGTTAVGLCGLRREGGIIHSGGGVTSLGLSEYEVE